MSLGPRLLSDTTQWELPSHTRESFHALQGTLDLIVLRTLQTMGRQHAYAIATGVQQVSEDLLHLNQGSLGIQIAGIEAVQMIRKSQVRGITRKNLHGQAWVFGVLLGLK